MSASESQHTEWLASPLAGPATDTAPGDLFLQRVRRATRNVLGNTPLGQQVVALCEDHARSRAAILNDRAGGAAVVAVVGATGQGKSWLVRQMIRRSGTRELIASGNNLDQATEKLRWIGPMPPADLDASSEEFLMCPADQMEPIGTPYLIVDSPGATDDRQRIADVARRALAMATVLVLVVRRDQMRSHSVTVLNQIGEGTMVVPVINAVRDGDDSVAIDADAFQSRLRKTAPASLIVRPVIVADFDTVDQGEDQVGHQAAQQVASAIEKAMVENGQAGHRQATRLNVLDTRFRSALHSILRDRLPGLSNAVQSLHRETKQIPSHVAESLLGSGGSLRAVVRSRLRLSLMENTSAIWFPYRSILGVLNLTSGAWDRLLLSLSGSLPSLIGTIWAGTRNVMEGQNAASEIREGLLRRSNAAIDDRLRPLTLHFRSELSKLRQDAEPGDGDHSDSAVASLAGLDTLQEESQRIVQRCTDAASWPAWASTLAGLIGTTVFWALLAGPIVALYREYLSASYGVVGQGSAVLESFPHPNFSMILTSVLLSLLPMAVFAMWVVAMVQRRGKVHAVETQIRDEHHHVIGRMQSDGVLRLRWDDPLLADAEFLLSIGLNSMPGDRSANDLGSHDQASNHRPNDQSATENTEV